MKYARNLQAGSLLLMGLLFVANATEAGAAAKAKDREYTVATGNGDTFNICVRKAETGKSECKPATAADRLGYTRSTMILPGSNRPQVIYKKLPEVGPKNRQTEFEACRNVTFLEKNFVEELAEKEKAALEKIARVCEGRFQVYTNNSLPSWFWHGWDRALANSAKVENEAQSMLDAGIRVGAITLDSLDQMEREMQRARCCFRAQADGILGTPAGEIVGKLNESCGGIAGSQDIGRSVLNAALLEKDEKGVTRDVKSFCENRIKNVREAYNNYLPQVRHNLIRAGQTGYLDDEQLGCKEAGAQNKDKCKPGRYMNLELAETKGTFVPFSETKLPFTDLTISRSENSATTYTPIGSSAKGSAEREAAVADEKTWLTEIEAKFLAEKPKHEAEMLGKMAEYQRTYFPNDKRPVRKFIESFRYRDTVGEPLPVAKDELFLYDPTYKQGSNDAISPREEYFRRELEARRKEHREKFREILGEFPIFGYLAKDAPTDAEFAEAYARLIVENNLETQETLTEAMGKAVAEREAARKENRDPDPLVATEFMLASNVWDHYLEKRPELCGAATSLQKIVEAKTMFNDIRLGVGGAVLAGATLGTGLAVAGVGGAAAFSGGMAAGGLAVGAGFAVRDAQLENEAYRSVFSGDGFVTAAIDPGAPATLEAIEEARKGKILSAATIFIPGIGDGRAIAAAGIGVVAAYSGAKVGARAGAKRTVASLGRELARGNFAEVARQVDRRAVRDSLRRFTGKDVLSNAEENRWLDILNALAIHDGSPNQLLPSDAGPEFTKAFEEVGRWARGIVAQPGLADLEDMTTFLRLLQNPEKGVKIPLDQLTSALNSAEAALRLGYSPEDSVALLKRFVNMAQENQGMTEHFDGLAQVLRDALTDLKSRNRKLAKAIDDPSVSPADRRAILAQVSDRDMDQAIRTALGRNLADVPEAERPALREQLFTCARGGTA